MNPNRTSINRDTIMSAQSPIDSSRNDQTIDLDVTTMVRPNNNVAMFGPADNTMMDATVIHGQMDSSFARRE